MVCCGFFRKRGKSLPPGGTQVKDDKKQKKKDKKQTTSSPDLNNIEPVHHSTENVNNLTQILAEAQQNEAYKDEDIEPEIYPVPDKFRGTNSETREESETGDDDYEDIIRSKVETNRNGEVDVLTELNKDLQNELKSTLSKRTTEKVDQLENSFSSTDSASRTLRSGQLAQMVQKQPQYDQPSSALASVLRETRDSENLRIDSLLESLPPNTSMNSKKLQFSPNQTNASANLNEQSNNANELTNYSIQRLVESLNIDKNLLDTLRDENRNLKSLIDDLKNELLVKETKHRQDNEMIMSSIQNTLAKETRTESERQALFNVFLSKQQQNNENLIQEQARVIDMLKVKCENYETELKNSMNSNNYGPAETYRAQIKDYKEEISALRIIVHKLNAELSLFQSKYPEASPSLQASIKKIELTPLPSYGPTPIWLVNTKFLSPLIAAYDDRIIEKDEKLKLLRKKIDDLTTKFKTILEENTQLNSRLENVYSSGRIANDPYELNDINKIRNQAILVLEENKALNEQVELAQSKLSQAQRNTILEMNSLSKKIIFLESEKVDLKNELEKLKINYDDLLHKYNDITTEAQSRVKLQEHLNQTGELKRKLDEKDVYHKYEQDQTNSKIFALEGEKKDLLIKNASLSSENKRLTAENQVLDKALTQGIGRKTQRRIKELETLLESAQIKENTNVAINEKLISEMDSLKIEKEAAENLVNEIKKELKKMDNKLSEENLKYLKLETKLDDLKQKSATKLANQIEKHKRIESEFGLNKLEYDKKIADLLNLLYKKQNEIDSLIREKRQMEGDLEVVWQSTMNENRQLKEQMLDMRIKPDSVRSSSHYRLLLDE